MFCNLYLALQIPSLKHRPVRRVRLISPAARDFSAYLFLLVAAVIVLGPVNMFCVILKMVKTCFYELLLSALVNVPCPLLELRKAVLAPVSSASIKSV